MKRGADGSFDLGTDDPDATQSRDTGGGVAAPPSAPCIVSGGSSGFALHRRDLVVGAAAGFLASALAVPGARAAGPAGTQAAPASPTAPPRRPNIVLLVADDLGWGDLACYGNTLARTPHLDKLAARGCLYMNGYAPSTVCSSSRVGTMTGRFPSRDRFFSWLGEDPKRPNENRDRGMPDFLDLALPALPRALKQVGYTTGFFGKWHIGKVGAPEPRAYGFDAYKVASGNGPWFPTGGKPFRPISSRLIVDEAIQFIDAHAGAPFFLQLAFLDPHVPLDPVPEDRARCASTAGVLGIYCSVLEGLDAHVGRLLAHLETRGLAGDTVVVFTSDNGPAASLMPDDATIGGGTAGPLRGMKGCLYDGGIRVPFLVRWPNGMKAGRVDDRTVIAGTDLLPTFCALAGAPLPTSHAIDGEDLSAAFRGAPVDRSRALFWDWRYPQRFRPALHSSPSLAMRWQHWKLLANPDGSRTELYDLRSDLAEVDNLAREVPSVVDALRPQLLAWWRSLPEAPVPSTAGQVLWTLPKATP